MKQGFSLLSGLAWLQVASAGCCRSNQCLKAIADPLVNGQQDCSLLIETVTVTPGITTITETATEIPTEYASLVETDISTVTVTSTVSTETLLSTLDTTVTAGTATQSSVVYQTHPYATVTVFVTSTSTIIPENTVTIVPRHAAVDTEVAPVIDTTASPSIPSYASADCQSWDQYVSACRCVGVTQQTVTASPSAATVTVTFTESAASTISVPTTISITTTVVESETATEADTQINTASLTETVTTTVTGNVLVVGSTATVTSTVIQTVAPPVESCRSDAGDFRVSATTDAGSDLYMFAETSGSPGGVSGAVKWVGAPTDSTNPSNLYKYQWYVDASGMLAMTYTSATLKLTAWVETTATAASVQLRVSSSVGSASIYTKVQACVSSVTGALTLDAGGRKNILMCGQNFYISSGTGSDTGLACTRMYPKIASVGSL